MRLTLTEDNLKEIIAEHEFANRALLTNKDIEQAHNVSYKGITGKYDLWANKDFIISRGQFRLEEELTILAENDYAGVEMHFSLGSGYTFTETAYQCVKMQRNEQNLFAYTPMKSRLNISKSDDFSFFEINFSEAYAQKLLQDIDGTTNFLSLHNEGISIWGKKNGPISREMFKVINELLDCPYSDQLKHIYTEAKTLELLALQIDSFASQKERTESLNKKDAEQLQFARQLIHTNIMNPVTIPVLAKQIGMNETKLKKSFKEIFGTTIFNYLTDLRMSVARDYLLDGGLTITEVSELVGYKNPQHFTVAFKRKYGNLPKFLKNA